VSGKTIGTGLPIDRTLTPHSMVLQIFNSDRSFFARNKFIKNIKIEKYNGTDFDES